MLYQKTKTLNLSFEKNISKTKCVVFWIWGSFGKYRTFWVEEPQSSSAAAATRSLTFPFLQASLRLTATFYGRVLIICQTVNYVTKLTITWVVWYGVLMQKNFNLSKFSDKYTRFIEMWWTKPQFEKWWIMFSGGRKYFHDWERSGPTFSCDSQTHIKNLWKNERIRLFKIDGLTSFFLEILHLVLYEIVGSYLAYTKKCGLWVPKMLTKENKQKGMRAALNTSIGNITKMVMSF